MLNFLFFEEEYSTTLDQLFSAMFFLCGSLFVSHVYATHKRPCFIYLLKYSLKSLKREKAARQARRIAEQDALLAQELERRTKEKTRCMREMQKICEESEELRALESKLKVGSLFPFIYLFIQNFNHLVVFNMHIL